MQNKKGERKRKISIWREREEKERLKYRTNKFECFMFYDYGNQYCYKK